jgi:hypothetical protein
MRKALAIISFFAVVLLMEDTGWSQCAMCRTALQSSPEGQVIAEGFRKGIIFLLATPYAILGSIGFGVFRAFKKQKQNPTEK